MKPYDREYKRLDRSLEELLNHKLVLEAEAWLSTLMDIKRLPVYLPRIG